MCINMYTYIYIYICVCVYRYIYIDKLSVIRVLFTANEYDISSSNHSRGLSQNGYGTCRMQTTVRLLYNLGSHRRIRL